MPFIGSVDTCAFSPSAKGQERQTWPRDNAGFLFLHPFSTEPTSWETHFSEFDLVISCVWPKKSGCLTWWSEKTEPLIFTSHQLRNFQNETRERRKKTPLCLVFLICQIEIILSVSYRWVCRLNQVLVYKYQQGQEGGLSTNQQHGGRVRRSICSVSW